jgi:hypothetical protein
MDLALENLSLPVPVAVMSLPAGLSWLLPSLRSAPHEFDRSIHVIVDIARIRIPILYWVSLVITNLLLLVLLAIWHIHRRFGR